MNTQQLATSNIIISDIQPGHNFSELSHYTFVERTPAGMNVFLRHGTNEYIEVSDQYVEEFMKTSDQYQTVQYVGKVDTFWTQNKIDKAIKDGIYTAETAPAVDSLHKKGIRTIFEEIDGKHVFSCMFKAQSKETKAQLEARKAEQRALLMTQVRTGLNKSELNDLVETLISKAQDDPIVKEERDRVLKGYKMQFKTTDGKYQCMDLTLDPPEPRPVNINTLVWLVYDGVKSIVK